MVGTVDWLGQLYRPLNKLDRAQLRHIKSFLKIETTKQYQCKKTGKMKCVRHLYTSDLRLLFTPSPSCASLTPLKTHHTNWT